VSGDVDRGRVAPERPQFDPAEFKRLVDAAAAAGEVYVREVAKVLAAFVKGIKVGSDERR
jgi:hypothetical protein